MVKDGGDPLLDAVHVQRVRAGPGAGQGQAAVNGPPGSLQHLQKAGGAVAVNGEAPGQGGVDVGVGVDEPGHDDAAPGVHQLRLRVLLPQLGGGAHGGNALSVDGYAAVLQVGQGAVPGDESAVCQNVHRVFLLFLLWWK